jgi:hypothetical protein
LTENDSRQCPHQDSQQKKTAKKYWGRKIHEYGKPKTKIDPTSGYVEMVNKYTLSITLGYIVL